MAFTDKKIDINVVKTSGIQSLKDKPNQPAQYGDEGLSAAQLKKKFDLLPEKIIEAFNNLVAYLEENYSGEIKISDEKYTTLAALVEAIRGGGFAEILKVKTDEEQTLTEFVASVGSGNLANSLKIPDTPYTTLAALVEAIRGGGFAEILKVKTDEENTKTLSKAIQYLYKTTPLVVDEVLDLGVPKEEIERRMKTKDGYTNSIDAISLNKDPKEGEKFWCIVKSSDNYLFTAVAEITEPINERGFYPFKLVEAIEIYNPLLVTKYIPLIVDEVLLVPATSNEIKKGYKNSIDAISLNKEPEEGEKFWCLIKTEDDYIFSAVAEITEQINKEGNYPFKLTEAYVIYEPIETLHLKSETEQVVDSDVKFKKDVTIDGDLKVNGENYVVDAKTLFVKDQYVICNENENGTRTQSGFVIITSAPTISGNPKSYPAYGIVYDETFDSVRLGEGTVVMTDEGTEEQTATFTFAENASQAIATRSDSGEDALKGGNLVVWDAVKKCLVDANIDVEDIDRLSNNLSTAIANINSQLGDIDSALDELHAYAQALINGGAEQ